MTHRPPLRVTHVVFDLEGGGLESFVANMARHHALRPDLVRMSIVTLSGRPGRLGESVRDLVDAFVVLRPRRGLSMFFPLGLTRALRRLRPDVVHLHSGAWYKPALAARIAGVPRVIYTEHGRVHEDPWHARALDRVAARLTDAIVTVSDTLHAYMVKQVGVAPARLRAIPNGVDVVRFAPGPTPPTEGRPLVIGSVGRLAVVKGQDVLIEAVALLSRMPDVPPFEVMIAGDGPERPQWETLIEARGIGRLVRLLGWSDDPAPVYRNFDVYVLPSRSEGMSISLLEAMASGVAPVVTRVGSNAELVGPALQDQVVAPEDPSALAGCILDTLRSAGRRRTAAGEARRRVLAHYDWLQTVAAYDALYRQAPLTDAASIGGADAPKPDAVGVA